MQNESNQYNPRTVYNGAREIARSAEQEAYERAAIFTNLYNTAVKEGGYTQRQLANNKGVQMELVRKMFELANDEKLNPSLNKSVFYKGLEGANDYEKMQMHRLALGADLTTFQEIVKQGKRRWDYGSFVDLVQNRLGQQHVESTLENYLGTQIGGNFEEQWERYKQLAEQDPNIEKVNYATFDLDELQDLAKQGIIGTINRSSLEDRVGILLEDEGNPERDTYLRAA